MNSCAKPSFMGTKMPDWWRKLRTSPFEAVIIQENEQLRTENMRLKAALQLLRAEAGAARGGSKKLRKHWFPLHVLEVVDEVLWDAT